MRKRIVTTPRGKITLVLATEQDIPRVVSFLSTPEIDQSFVPPLSQRNTSIKERVRNRFLNGFWLLAVRHGNVIGCRGCKGLVDRHNKVVEFSTLAVSSAFRGCGLVGLLLRTAAGIALERYSPLVMKFDSWVGNTAVEKAALRVGFIRHRAYDDPSKRPPGVQSVEYILDCSSL